MAAKRQPGNEREIERIVLDMLNRDTGQTPKDYVVAGSINALYALAGSDRRVAVTVDDHGIYAVE